MSLTRSPTTRLVAAAAASTLALRLFGIVRSGFALVFVFVCVWCLAWAFYELRRTPSAGVRRISCMSLAGFVLAVLLVFDIAAADIFALPKFVVLLVGAVTLFLVTAASTRGRFLWVRVVHWPVLAVALWSAFATVFSTNPRVSILGFVGSYDGLLTAVAVALLFVVFVELVTINDLERWGLAIFIGAGIPALVYGLIGIHDLFFSPRWNWVELGGAAMASTFGNPNHFGGFLAMMSPIGVVLFFSTNNNRRRALLAGCLLLVIVELFFARSVGAWLALASGLVVLGLFLIPLARPLKRRILWGLGLITAATMVLTLAGVGPFGAISERASASSRAEYWDVAAEMSAERPLLGYGPDNYRSYFGVYQDPEFVAFFGSGRVVNGAHNIFLNLGATQGLPAVLIFLGFVAMVLMRSGGAFRALGRIEDPGPRAERVRSARLLVAGLTASAVAFLVQASFNVQVIPLTVLFWGIAALLTSAAVDAGVPDSFDPRLIWRAKAPDLQPRSGRGQRRARQAPAGQLPVANDRRDPLRLRSDPLYILVAVAVSVALTWFLSAPYRADRLFYEGRVAQSVAGGLEPEESLEALAFARERFGEANQTNPWEARYARDFGRTSARMAVLREQLELVGEDEYVEELHGAADWLERAAELQPRDRDILASWGEILLVIHGRDPSDEAAFEGGTDAFERAIEVNPFDPALWQSLASAYVEVGDEEAAQEVARRASRYLAEGDLPDVTPPEE